MVVGRTRQVPVHNHEYLDIGNWCCSVYEYRFNSSSLYGEKKGEKEEEE